MFPDLQKNFLFMIVLSMLGWMMEVICKSFEYHRYINRGFLIGPWCPVYGVGSLLIVHLLDGYADRPAAVFLLGMVVCGALEYITSYLLEKIFHARWWDYSRRRFNLNGRICANTLIPFGLLGLLLIYLIQPFLFGLFDRLSMRALNWLFYCVLAVFGADVIVSCNVLGKIRKHASCTGADDTEMLTRAVREQLSKASLLARRTLRAYPGLKLYNGELLEKMRQKRQEIQQEAVDARRKIREDMDAYEQRIREAIQEKRKDARK